MIIGTTRPTNQNTIALKPRPTTMGVPIAPIARQVQQQSSTSAQTQTGPKPEGAFTVSEVGARIRSANPTAFEGFSDDEIGKRALERKPELAEHVQIVDNQTAPSIPIQAPNARQDNMVKEAAVGAGKGLISTLKGAADLGEKIVGAPSRWLGLAGNKKSTDIIPEKAYTPQNTAQKVGFGIEQAAEFFAPVTKVAKVNTLVKGATEATNFGRATKGAINLLGRAATEGVGMGGVRAVQTGGDMKEVGNAALTGAAFPFVGAALSPVAKQVFEKLPQRIIQNVVGQSKAQRLAGKDISEYVLKSKKIGTANSLIEGSSRAVKDLSEQIQYRLDEVASKTTRILKNDVLGQVARKINVEGGDVTTREVAEIIDNLAPQIRSLLKRQSLDLAEANKLRQALDATLGDKSFLVSQLPYNKTILKTFDDILREKVKSLAPEGTRELFEELSKEITLRNALMSKYAVSSRNEMLNGFDLLLGGGGLIGGGIPGAVGAMVTKKLVQSPLLKTSTAQMLRGGGVLGTKAKSALPILKGGTVNIFGASSNDR